MIHKHANGSKIYINPVHDLSTLQTMEIYTVGLPLSLHLSALSVFKLHIAFQGRSITTVTVTSLLSRWSIFMYSHALWFFFFFLQFSIRQTGFRGNCAFSLHDCTYWNYAKFLHVWENKIYVSLETMLWTLEFQATELNFINGLNEPHE